MTRAIVAVGLLGAIALQGCTVGALSADLSQAHSVREVSPPGPDAQGSPVLSVVYECGRTANVRPKGVGPIKILGPLETLPAAEAHRETPGTLLALVEGQPHLYRLEWAPSGVLHWNRVPLPDDERHYTAGRVLVHAAVVVLALAADVAVVGALACALGGGAGQAFGEGVAIGFGAGLAGSGREPVSEPPPTPSTGWVVKNTSGRTARVHLHGALDYYRELPPGEQVTLSVEPGTYTSEIRIEGYRTHTARFTLKRGQQRGTYFP